MDSRKLVSDVVAERKKLSEIRRHIFICLGDTCCKPEQGAVVWDYLKAQLASRGLSEGPGARVFRTKVGCLRVCADGPIALVYPEGTWYRLIDQSAIDAIISEHLIGGKPVLRYAFSHSTLAPVGAKLEGVAE